MQEDEDRDEDEDWPPTTIKVVCVGLGRTGTTSLAIAFDMLGHHSYHDDQLLEVAFDDDEDDEEMFEEVRVSSVAASVTSRKKGCIFVLCRSIVVLYDDHCTIISSSISSLRSSRFASTQVGKKGYDVSFRTDATTAVKNNAKVILTVRDSPESCARSWAKLAHACIVSLQRIPFKWFARVQEFYPTLEDEVRVERMKHHE